jgi:hypothetical protein
LPVYSSFESAVAAFECYKEVARLSKWFNFSDSALRRRFFNEPINPTAGVVQAKNPFDQIRAAA